MRPWSNDQVLLWLRNSGYTDEIVSAFRSHNITGLVLPFLNTEELKEMGIPNLKIRLKLMRDISTALSELNSGFLSFESDHPVMSQLQSTIMATSLINILSQSIRDDVISGSEYNNKSLLHQFTKLREDLLPILKELKDKKPLPTPAGGLDVNLRYNHASPTREQVQDALQQNEIDDHQKYRGNVMSDGATITSSRSDLRNSRLSQIDNQDQETINSLSSAISSAELLTAFTAVKEKPRIVPSGRNAPVRRTSSNGLSAGKLNDMTHRSSYNSSNEQLKQLRARKEDRCYKILQAAMRSHGLDISEWKNYALVIVYGGDQERILGYDEMPVMIFKELQDLGLNPSMMLRQVDEEEGLDYSKFDTPGGRL